VCNTFVGRQPSALCAALNAPDVSSGGVAGDITTYTNDRAAGRTNYQSYLDGLLTGTDALVVPASSPLVGFADRAGYPVLEMQSGYQFTFSSNTNFGQIGYAPTHNPYGIALIGTANSEQTLLRDAYAIEQRLNTQTAQSITRNTTQGNLVYTDAHVAPSIYNPAMYRCIQGSAYYDPYKCHPGEIGYVSPVKAPVTPAEPTTPAAPAPTPPAAPVPPAAAPPTAAQLLALLTTAQKKDLAKAIKGTISTKATQVKIGDTFRIAGKVTYTLMLSVVKGGKTKHLTLGTATRTITGAKTVTTTIKLTRTGRALLKRYTKSKVTLGTRFVPKAGGKAITSTRTVKRR
jgi:hypothetical protein